MSDKKNIQMLSTIVAELEARETSNNCPYLTNFSWNELCDKGIELFEELIQPIKG